MAKEAKEKKKPPKKKTTNSQKAVDKILEGKVASNKEVKEVINSIFN